MRLPEFRTPISRKLLLIVTGIIIVTGVILFIWEKNKYRIVNHTIANTIAKKTDSLYSVKYDSLHFNELTGEAYLKNIHIEPDTIFIKTKELKDLPYVLLDIKIASLSISGVKTDKAFLGKKMIGDSVIIDQATVTIYFVKPVQKHTRIEAETRALYDEILGNLKRIEVGNVFINHINIKGFGFFTKEKDFDLSNGNIQLNKLLIDSLHSLDTSRTLFCKQAALQVGSFIAYNNTRPELRVDKIIFSGKDKLLSFASIALNSFETANGDSSELFYATNLNIHGLNTNEMVNNKDIIVDTITCTKIIFFQAPLKLKVKNKITAKPLDSSGFRHVYSIDMKHLSFPKINFIPRHKSDYTIGDISLKINEIKAGEIIQIQTDPLEHTKEAEVSCDKISINSKDGMYKYTLQNASINSLQKQLTINSFIIKPFLPENAFAEKAYFQKDRYDVALRGIALKNINLKNVFDNKIIASDLVIKNVSAKDYIDLHKPMSGKSKVGNYPAQLLSKIDFPISISHVLLQNAFVEYRENETLSDSTGDAKFSESTITIDNVTNIPEIMKQNNVMKISFQSKALTVIPVEGSFTFFLNDTAGRFAATGHIPSFDSHLLNVVSVPMALLKLNSGVINSLDFNLKGDNFSAGGQLVMKYSDLKIDLLKNDKKLNNVKKKKLTSFIANTIIKNNNPANGKLREVNAHFDRNTEKSFFNLLWRTILNGMKKTVGIP